ncbi:AbrB/MazE/SpoVT family DNA-binding domain-containing protein [Listeria weihenstephanensis]|nr:AbrB/MazE/SpoVT family DNA-binding domain-containing protein [Listeria weihenstephanensis]
MEYVNGDEKLTFDAGVYDEPFEGTLNLSGDTFPNSISIYNVDTSWDNKFISEGGIFMTTVSIKKWGNSKAVRIPNNILNALNLHENDKLNIEVVDNQMILTKTVAELTIEDLFANYEGETFQTKLQEFEPMGNEKW